MRAPIEYERDYGGEPTAPLQSRASRLHETRCFFSLTHLSSGTGATIVPSGSAQGNRHPAGPASRLLCYDDALVRAKAVLPALVALMLLVSSCGGSDTGDGSGDAWKPSEATIPPAIAAVVEDVSLPDVSPDEGVSEAWHQVRALLVAELGLGDVLTDEAFAAMDAAAAQAIADAFPDLGQPAQGFHGFRQSQTDPLPGSPGVGGTLVSGTVALTLFRDMWNDLQRTTTTPEARTGSQEFDCATDAGRARGGACVGGNRNAKSVVSGSIKMEGRKIIADLTVTTTYTVDEKAYTEVARITGEADACPDAEGTLALAAELELTISGDGSSSRSTLGGTATGHVGDDAWLQSVDLDVATTDSATGPIPLGLTYRSGVSNGPKGDVSISLDDFIGARGGGNLDRSQLVVRVLIIVMYGKAFAESVFSSAQDAWRNGACVTIEVPEGLNFDTAAHEPVTVTAHVKHKWEGGDLAVPVTANLTGTGSVVPGRIDPAPDTFIITADAAPGVTADLETVSRRGRDTESVRIDVGAWVASTVSGRITVSGVVANVHEAFTLEGTFEGGSATLSFTPTSDQGGTMSYSGGGSGVTVSGDGTYTLTDDRDGSYTLSYSSYGCTSVGTCADQQAVISLDPQDPS